MSREPHELGLGQLFRILRDAVIVVDATTGRIVLWNPAAERLFGYRTTEVVDRPIDILIPTHLQAQLWAGLERARTTGPAPSRAAQVPWELWARRKTGEEISIELLLSPLDAGPVGERLVVAVIRDLTVHKQAEAELRALIRRLQEANAQLRHLASQDPLTGVTNRRGFAPFYRREWRRARRLATPLALLLLDIDDFKLYNDHYGHRAGDACLRRIARAMRAVIHRPGDCAVRYGGDEFVIVLANTPRQGAAIVAERLRARIEALGIPHAPSPISDHVTVSIGGATTIPDQASSPSMLVGAADQALYQAKGAGRNCVRIAEVSPFLSQGEAS